MSAAVTLSNLAWSTPDGRELFSGLNISFGAERAGLVGRNGVGKSTLLKIVTGEQPPRLGNVSTSGRIAVLRQIVQLDAGETIADMFGVADQMALLERAASGEAGADDLAAADWTSQARLGSALARFGLDASGSTRIATLSGGQRTRAALAALVFAEPDFIILDEPTNNLDRDGRAAVLELLSTWRAGAVVVSHDRELLETMDAIVELTALGVQRYGGNWSAYRESKAMELASARRDLADAERRMADLAQTTQDALERKARKDGAGKRKAARGGMPRIAIGATKRWAESTGGAMARLAESRREEAQAGVVAARARIEVLQPLTVSLASVGLATQKQVLNLSEVTVGYAPGAPVLQRLSFSMTGPERVGVTGPNGSGKSTLLALIAGDLQPWAGNVRVQAPFAVLDQRMGMLDPALSIHANFQRINPQDDENACRAALARFMFRAAAAMQIVGTLSGGQMLRAGLACALGGGSPPQLLVLDEPTNHLDLESIEAVETGLRAFDGALLAVSHDEAFLEAIGVTRRLSLSR